MSARIINLKALRRACQLTQNQLGERAGIGARHVYYIETGRREPSLHTLMQIARVVSPLTVSVDGETFALVRVAEYPVEPVLNGVKTDLVQTLLRVGDEFQEALEVLQTLPEAVNALAAGQGSAWLSHAVEQILLDPEAGIQYAKALLARERPEILAAATERHQTKLVERGYRTPA